MRRSIIIKTTGWILLYFLFPIKMHGQQVQTVRDDLLQKILKDKSEQLDEVMNNPSRYNFQLIYTRVVKRNSESVFEERSLNKDKFYFNPASLIKFPLAVLAMEYMQQLKNNGVLLQHFIKLHTCSCDKETENYVNRSWHPTLEQFLREMMIMSDNDAYNLFFDLLGMDKFNERIRQIGYDGIKMSNRFTAGCSNQNIYSGGIDFLSDDSLKIYEIPCDTSIMNFSLDKKYPLSYGRF